MLRTIFMIGLFAMLGIFAINLVFGILPFILGVFAALVVLAIKIALFGLVIYLVIRLLSPDTARRMREKWSGSSL